MYRTISAVTTALVVTLSLLGAGGAVPGIPGSASSANAQSSPAPTIAAPGTPPERSTDDAPVVSATGLADIQVGDTRTALAQQHGLRQGPAGCAPQLPEYPSISPVFEEDELVLLWAHSPAHTAQGLTVGSPVDDVHAAHPNAAALPAPEGSHRFDGLLAEAGDRAYLFLHDGDEVRKVIVGSETHLHRLLQDDFGTC